MKKSLLVLLLLLPVLPLAAARDQVLWHLPKEKLGQPVLFGSRVVDVNRPMGKVFAAGQRNPRPVMMSFERDTTGIFLIPRSYQPFMGTGSLLKYYHVQTVYFPIVEESADTLTLDISRYFYRYPRQISAIPPNFLRKEVILGDR